MDFVTVVDQAIALLRQRGRLTYRTLQLAVQEGACDETPFEELCFPLSIWNWHFVVKTAQKSFLWASEYGKNGRFLPTAEIFAQPFVTR